MSSEQTKEEIEIETITELGRAVATSLLKSAITTAESVEQMTTQLEVTYRAGIHLLAVHIFNRVDQRDSTAEQNLADILRDLREEFDRIVAEGEMELFVAPGVQ